MLTECQPRRLTSLVARLPLKGLETTFLPCSIQRVSRGISDISILPGFTVSDTFGLRVPRHGCWATPSPSISGSRDGLALHRLVAGHHKGPKDHPGSGAGISGGYQLLNHLGPSVPVSLCDTASLAYGDRMVRLAFKILLTNEALQANLQLQIPAPTVAGNRAVRREHNDYGFSRDILRLFTTNVLGTNRALRSSAGRRNNFLFLIAFRCTGIQL